MNGDERNDREGNCHSEWESGLALAWSGCTSLTAFIRVFMRGDALNARTRLGLIITSTPVFGFLPIRWPFLRTVNVPNPGNLTVSPRTTQSEISFKTDSVKSADSRRERPTLRCTVSYNSFRVTVLLASICATPNRIRNTTASTSSASAEGQAFTWVTGTFPPRNYLPRRLEVSSVV